MTPRLTHTRPHNESPYISVPFLFSGTYVLIGMTFALVLILSDGLSGIFIYFGWSLLDHFDRAFFIDQLLDVMDSSHLY